jgi:hypothetical protein
MKEHHTEWVRPPDRAVWQATVLLGTVEDGAVVRVEVPFVVDPALVKIFVESWGPAR